MADQDIERIQGHLVLSGLGKKVLRPGGKELTEKLLAGLEITNRDDVVEFAPGLGWTAQQVLKYHPHSYTGIELNKDTAQQLQKIINGENTKVITGNAASVNLPDAFAHKLYGEAMLTMHADQRKSVIIKEAYRLLKNGGLYGVHELGLLPDDISSETKAAIQKELALISHVNARPMTQTEWVALFEKEGFKVRKVFTHPMRLLHLNRMLDDEGLLNTLKIGLNILKNYKARKRVLRMRKIFRKYENEIHGVVVIAEK